jgi:hypothetical protein
MAIGRDAFEAVVAEAGSYLEGQLEAVRAQAPAGRRWRAILRAFAVQAISAYAEEGEFPRTLK